VKDLAIYRHKMARKILTTAAIAIFGCLVIAQFKTIQRTNPPLEGDLAAPPQINMLLRRACYDCHSNETRWPWYTYIAPVSWLIAHDVERGRQELNFSEWESYYAATRRRKLQWMDRALREENMPPWTYRVLHPGAGLTPQDLTVLEQWIEAEINNQAEKQSENRKDSK
jgi:Haem-binding domain